MVIFGGCLISCSKNAEPNNHCICITIDDAITNDMLDTLQKYNVKATFFPIAKNLDTAILHRTFAEGHEVGNHSFSHTSFKGLSLAKQQQETILADIKIGRITRYLRPPFGEYNFNTNLLGKRLIFWNQNVDLDLPVKPGIVLLHDVNRLEPLIREVQEVGLQISSLESCLP
jgi:peptidoglycan/xylan/chitin deacetylase (PgdA/CDA1 family)